jgi:hypothetical protein
MTFDSIPHILPYDPEIPEPGEQSSRRHIDSPRQHLIRLHHVMGYIGPFSVHPLRAQPLRELVDELIIELAPAHKVYQKLPDPILLLNNINHLPLAPHMLRVKHVQDIQDLDLARLDPSCLSLAGSRFYPLPELPGVLGPGRHHLADYCAGVHCALAD